MYNLNQDLIAFISFRTINKLSCEIFQALVAASQEISERHIHKEREEETLTVYCSRARIAADLAVRERSGWTPRIFFHDDPDTRAGRQESTANRDLYA